MSIIRSIMMQNRRQNHIHELTMCLIFLSYNYGLFITFFVAQSFALNIIKSWDVQTVTSFKDGVDEADLES